MKFTLWHQKSLVVSKMEVLIKALNMEKRRKKVILFQIIILFSSTFWAKSNLLLSITQGAELARFQLSPVWRMHVFADGWSVTKARPWASLFQMSLTFVLISDKKHSLKINK